MWNRMSKLCFHPPIKVDPPSRTASDESCRDSNNVPCHRNVLNQLESSIRKRLPGNVWQKTLHVVDKSNIASSSRPLNGRTCLPLTNPSNNIGYPPIRAHGPICHSKTFAPERHRLSGVIFLPPDRLHMMGARNSSPSILSRKQIGATCATRHLGEGVSISAYSWMNIILIHGFKNNRLPIGMERAGIKYKVHMDSQCM